MSMQQSVGLLWKHILHSHIQFDKHYNLSTSFSIQVQHLQYDAHCVSTVTSHGRQNVANYHNSNTEVVNINCYMQ